MTIGIDIRTLMGARPSGVSEYTRNLVREILRLDHENEYRLFLNSWSDCPNLSEFAGKNARVIQYNYPNKIFNYLLVKIFNWPKIDERLGADVWFMPHLNFIGLSGRAGSIITVHDLSFLKYPEFFSWRKNLWHKMINVKKLLQRFDLIVAVSENTKRDIVELCGVEPDKVKVVYSGVGEEYRKMTNDKFSMTNKTRNKYNLPDKFILYLGTLEPRKNVDGIIRAYNELRITNYELRDYKLVIAGSKGWKSEKIYEAWEQSEYKDDIKFLGYVDREDKPYLYNLASVFIYPSFYEGFGLPLLEAMASGCPVVASYSSSLPEVAADAALMADPYNVNDMAGALEAVLTSEKLRNSLIDKGLRQAKKFSWEKTARQCLEIFNHD